MTRLLGQSAISLCDTSALCSVCSLILTGVLSIKISISCRHVTGFFSNMPFCFCTDGMTRASLVDATARMNWLFNHANPTQIAPEDPIRPEKHGFFFVRPPVPTHMGAGLAGGSILSTPLVKKGIRTPNPYMVLVPCSACGALNDYNLKKRWHFCI